MNSMIYDDDDDDDNFISVSKLIAEHMCSTNRGHIHKFINGITATN